MEKIALAILLVFALVGAAAVSIIFHEYSHLNDFKEFNVTDEELCGLALPMRWINWSNFMHEPAGFYSYSIYLNKSNSTEMIKYQKKEENTEYKAYIISGVVFVFFLFCYWIIIFGKYRDKEKILNQEIDTLEKDFYIHQLESYILKHSSQDSDNSDYYDNTTT